MTFGSSFAQNFESSDNDIIFTLIEICYSSMNVQQHFKEVVNKFD